MKKGEHFYEIKAGGRGGRKLLFRPACSTGSVEDGVGLGDRYGWFVIPYEELEAMYEKAREIRGNTTTR